MTSPRSPWTLLLVEWDDPRAVALRDAMDAELSGRYADRFSAFDAETTERFERGAARLILQTGDRQPDAVALYERIGYTGIPIFPPYSDFDFSLCFEKPLAGVLA